MQANIQIHGSYGLVCMNNSFIFVYFLSFSFRVFPWAFALNISPFCECPKRMTKKKKTWAKPHLELWSQTFTSSHGNPDNPPPIQPYPTEKTRSSPSPCPLNHSNCKQTNKSLIAVCHRKWICIVGVLSGPVGNFPCPLLPRLPSGCGWPPSLLHTGGVQTPFGWVLCHTVKHQ